MTDSAPRVLLIDDEAPVRLFLKLSLEHAGYEVVEAASGAAGLDAADQKNPDAIILDLALPDISGLEVLKKIRGRSSVPVIMLTVSNSEHDKVHLLDSGADDYLTKPFSTAELLARLRVAERHQIKEDSAPSCFSSGQLAVDLALREVRVKGKLVKLTATEFNILQMLVKNAGRVVTQTHLLEQIWGVHAVDNSHYLRIYIRHLRAKLEMDHSLPKLILTEPGVGYRLVVVN